MTDADQIYALRMALLILIQKLDRKVDVATDLAAIVPTLPSQPSGKAKALNELIEKLHTGYNNGPSAAL